MLPVSEKTLEYAQDVTEKLSDAGIRVVLDDDNQKIGYKIRAAQQVAYALNFSNQSAFGKYFKHLTGMSPTEYQKS